MLEDYKDEQDEQKKKEIIEEFKSNLWESNFRFSSYKKYYKYKVNEKSLGNRDDLITLFKQYEILSFRYCKSFYKNRKMQPIDYIRVHINNMYGYLVDKNVYLDTEYYKLLMTPKNLYYETVKKLKRNEVVDSEELRNEINDAFLRAELIKSQSHEKKLKLKLSEYKKIINDRIERIFNNYLTPEEYEDAHGWEMLVEHDGWTEDHYVVKYFCKSLTGYMMMYMRDIKPKEIKQKKCAICGVDIETTSNRKKYCEKCWKTRLKELRKESNKRYYNKVNIKIV